MKSGDASLRKTLKRLVVPSLFILLVHVGAARWARPASAGHQPQKESQAAADRDWSDADRDRWLVDFQQLIGEMSSHYANLEWAVTARHMDLAALRSATESKIRSARSEDEERKILTKFLDAFGDGHLELSWPKESVDSGRPENESPEGKGICSRLGYAHRGKAGLNFSLLAKYRPLDDADSPDFAGGVLKLASGLSVGIIRIGVFSERGFPDACAEATTELRLADSGPCDDNCGDQVETATANILLRKLERRAVTLRKAGAAYIVLDITQNGGGSDWVDPVARTLSPVRLQAPRMAFMRHPHWTQQLQDMLDDIGTDLRNGKSPRDVLERSEKVMQEAVRQSKEPCDQAPLWTDRKPSCSLMVPGLRFPVSVFPYATPGSFRELKSRTKLFYSLRYSYKESFNQLPLVVLVDKDTWSAAEYLPAALQDNKAALTVGELTGGAGCGYTNDGISTVLKNSHATVQMPDCIRLRANGSNEVEGITPDVLVAWTNRDTPFQRVHKLELALEAALRKEKATRSGSHAPSN